MNDLMLSYGETTLRLLVAAGLGSLVGWERERKEGAAGLRTHMLVCVGSTLMMIVSMHGFGDVIGKPGIALDPSRIAAQVVSGIGFLGAGTILFLKPRIVKGLTTAAGLWSVAGVGLAVGGGLYWEAVLTTGIIFIILALFKPLEQNLFRSQRMRTFTLTVDPDKISLSDIESIIRKNELRPSEITMHSTEAKKHEQIRIVLASASDRQRILAVVKDLKSSKGVQEIISHIKA